MSTVVGADRSAVYSALVDWRQLVGLVDGLDELRPAGETAAAPASAPAAATAAPGAPAPDVGARFTAVVATVGSQRTEAPITLSRLVPEELVVWSIEGEDSRELAFSLSDISGGRHGSVRSEVALAVSYQLPSGIKGRMIAPLVDETLRSRVRGTLRRLEERFGAA